MTNAFASHDHGGCVSAAVHAVEGICAERGLRLTAPRRRVLEILLEEHRALDFLVEQGFAHRIERLNAFVACPCPARRHRPAFMVCRGCRAVAEADAPEGGPLAAGADRLGFLIERTVVEAEGLCPACAAAA